MKKNNLLTFSLLVMIVLINSTLIKANDLVLLNYEPVAENDHLQLYLNRETTEIAVKERRLVLSIILIRYRRNESRQEAE